MLPPLLALLLALLAYQVPAASRIDVGALGDQFFLPSSEAQREQQIAGGAWYADQIDAQGGRSRWSRERAALQVPGLGAGQNLRLTLELAGWPDDVARAEPEQPEVRVVVGAREIARFQPSPDVAAYSFDVPAELRSGADLQATLHVSPTFTDTAAYTDPRPKGIRLDAFTVAPAGWGARPDWSVAFGLALAAALAIIAVPTADRRSRLGVLAGILVAVLGAGGLIAARAWLVAGLPAVLVALALAAAVANRRSIRCCPALDRRAARPRPRAGLRVAGGAARVCRRRTAARPVSCSDPGAAGCFAAPQRNKPRIAGLARGVVRDSGRHGTAGGAAVMMILPRRVLRLRGALLTTRLAPALLLLASAIWLAYLFWLIWSIPVVGHADYADNAVVARNLLRGRGWVVDYVTQFYRLEPDGTVTRLQETWPLLQPLLMLPAMWLLGPTPFAARLVNLPLLAALVAMVYAAGARYWDRRAGLLAALLVMLNVLFFRLAIYASSDLALVVWSFAAFWLAFEGDRWLEGRKVGRLEGWKVEGWKSLSKVGRFPTCFQPFNFEACCSPRASLSA